MRSDSPFIDVEKVSSDDDEIPHFADQTASLGMVLTFNTVMHRNAGLDIITEIGSTTVSYVLMNVFICKEVTFMF